MPEIENIKAKRNLTALVEFSRIINSSLHLDFILGNVLLTCMGKYLSSRGLIALHENKKFVVKSVKGLTDKVLKRFPVEDSIDVLFESAAFKSFLVYSKLAVVEKLWSSEHCIGFMALGEKLNNSPYTEDDLEFLKTILNIASTAVQNSLVLNELKLVNRTLDTRVNRLNSLFELSKEFGMFSESTKVAKLLVYSVIGQFLVSKFAVVTLEGNSIKILESKIANDLLLNVLKVHDISLIVEPLTKESIFKYDNALAELGIELIVPMQIQGKSRGLILLGKRINGAEYSSDDIEFIYSVGGLAIISLENRRLFKEALEKQKMEEELEIARDIQRNLLPKNLPAFSNFDIAAVNVSSKQVGGDYYDVIQLNENNCCVAIADVSGKGVPASLLMANIQAFLKVICKHGMNIDEATALINDLITDNTSDGKFITFFWGIINNDEKTFEYTNAGHNPPLLVRDGKISKFEKGGIILGVMKTMMPYLKETVKLKKDDVLILFTDGVSEAMNRNGDEFSDERLEHQAIKLAEKSADEILTAIQTEVQNFTSGAAQSDDITIMVVKVK
ncbi:MAG: SpoIIE family protein phosphatase [Ignavibacteriaceae bacterium]|nr:SpoIIE family protein phosphatase [Ignavibacteriaceae bacterium]